MTTTFRSAHRGVQLREIILRSQQLSAYQQHQLAPLLDVSDAQSRQMRLIEEALEENASEYNGALSKQDLSKRTLLEELKGLKQSVAELAAQKKTLVREIRALRAELEGLSTHRDLYQFALHGANAALDAEKTTDQSERSQRQSNERAKQLAIMRLSRRRDESMRLLREATECSRRFRAVHKHVEDLEAQAAVFGGRDSRAMGDHHAGAVSAKSAAAAAAAAGRRKRATSHAPGRAVPPAGASASNSASSSSSLSPDKQFWGLRRISTALRRGRGDAGAGAAVQEHADHLGLGESVQVICACLAEGLVLEDKLVNLTDNASSEAAVLAPVASARDASQRADMKNDALATIEGLLRECCTLLDENTLQHAHVLRSQSFGRSSARECARAVALRATEAHRQLRSSHAEPTPPGLRMFLE
jgi:hypothetical protein